jgi:glycosyltransferase involved in cell wall biosynthesis
VYPWADAVVAGSKGLAKDVALVTRVPLQRIRVAPNPVVTDELFHMAREPVDHPWFAPGEDPVVLSAGRLTRAKDFPVLIRAFSRVYASRRCRLMVLGEGEERGALEALIDDLGLKQCVSLPGFVRNPFAYMRRAAVFVLSSAWEGLPGALIQALACGVPVVATDCENGPREILQDGRFGRLVPVGDVPALANAILAAVDGPRPIITQEAWSPFSQDAGVDAYLRIIDGVCDA